ncbi:VOC family protein [uncultured Brevundimonas sp.]|uniref:VOC family protein n=1 Tax=uncultured Brevundimonas sp. TaxID=213418 RepID=UPI002606CD74|nr:VOC family protein [uncultured Brevundimonas sp.]
MAEDHDTRAPTAGIIPHLTIPSRGGQAAMEFYGRAFGAEVLELRLADDGERILHAHLRLNAASLMLHDEFPERGGVEDVAPRGVILHLQVDDADEWWNRAILAGGVPVSPPADQAWGGRHGRLKDPFGHCWSIGSAVRGSARGCSVS